jgi:hypothetical protein
VGPGPDCRKLISGVAPPLGIGQLVSPVPVAVFTLKSTKVSSTVVHPLPTPTTVESKGCGLEQAETPASAGVTKTVAPIHHNTPMTILFIVLSSRLMARGNLRTSSGYSKRYHLTATQVKTKIEEKAITEAPEQGYELRRYLSPIFDRLGNSRPPWQANSRLAAVTSSNPFPPVVCY